MFHIEGVASFILFETLYFFNCTPLLNERIFIFIFVILPTTVHQSIMFHSDIQLFHQISCRYEMQCIGHIFAFSENWSYTLISLVPHVWLMSKNKIRKISLVVYDICAIFLFSKDPLKWRFLFRPMWHALYLWSFFCPSDLNSPLNSGIWIHCSGQICI